MNFLQRLFSQPKTEAAQPIVESAADINLATKDEQSKATTRLDCLSPGLHIGKLTDVGRERERNEDSLFTIESFMQHNYGQEPFGLFIVADGMGGHQKGEVASVLAARITADAILKEIYLPYLTNNQDSNNRPLNEVLISAVQTANTTVQTNVPDGGTTLTAALVMGNTAYIAHVGDTRVYLFKKNELKQVTQDHSLARRLEEMGQATAEEARHVQNVLYKAIGQGSSLEVDTYIQHVPPGASLLLCSDGLWGQVNDENIKDVLSTASAPQDACQTLISMANEKGGPDNITAIVVSLGLEN
jgi:serine/threonine protein phosphatase PrpC